MYQEKNAAFAAFHLGSACIYTYGKPPNPWKLQGNIQSFGGLLGE